MQQAVRILLVRVLGKWAEALLEAWLASWKAFPEWLLALCAQTVETQQIDSLSYSTDFPLFPPHSGSLFA